VLEPYRVLDLTDERGLLCGQILADLGADVIAVEPSDGSPARRLGPFAGDEPQPEQSLYWWAYSRNKRGITLDLTAPREQERFRRLVATADFLIESFDPGYLESLGLGYTELAAINPRLVMVSITPFGQQGPKAGWAASDLTALAASGVLLITGDSDRPPVQVPGTQAYLHAGAEAAVGALVAHTARERNGRGQHVDVSAQAAAMMATQSAILIAGWGGDDVSRVAGGLKIGPLHLPFVNPASDGYVSVSFLFGDVIGPFTRRLMTWLCEEGAIDAATRDKDWVGYVPLLMTGQEPVSELDRCAAAIARFTSTRTKAELCSEAKRRGLLIVPVTTTADLLASEQFAARDYWTAGESETGRAVTYPGPFTKLRRSPIAYRRVAPSIGEHNSEILAELERSPAPAMPSATNAPSSEAAELPFAGLKVLDFTWVFAGPMATRYLADYGATVIHVESARFPDALRGYAPFKDGVPGAERSGGYANVAAGKLGFSLNLGYPEAREIAMRLVEWADVVVENYSPKAMRNWGLHYDALQQIKPDIIMLSTCINGQTGPEAMMAGFGTMGAAMSGFHEVTGWPDRSPAGPYVAYTDYVSPKYIAAALVAALDHRRRTGEGQYIDLAQTECSMHFLAPALLDYTVNGRVDGRTGNASAEWAPNGVYPCAGVDRWVAIAAEREEQWRGLCTASGRLQWQTDSRFASGKARLANRQELDEAIAGWTRDLDVETIEQALQVAGVPVHRVTSSSDAFADPQLAHRGHFVTVKHPDLGPVPIESSRFVLPRTPARVTAAGPTFGQHNDQVLRDILKLTDDEIVTLAMSGALE